MKQTTIFDPATHFDGETYDAKLDWARLDSQLGRVRNLMMDGRWRTLDEISSAADAPGASVSARLRDLRKSKFGSHTVERRRRGGAERGLFEYRITQE